MRWLPANPIRWMVCLAMDRGIQNPNSLRRRSERGFTCRHGLPAWREAFDIVRNLTGGLVLSAGTALPVPLTCFGAGEGRCTRNIPVSRSLLHSAGHAEILLQPCGPDWRPKDEFRRRLSDWTQWMR